jgi:hypothetical protein
MAVFDFKKETFFKKVDKRLGRVRLDIDYAGVTRVRSAANWSPTDSVILSAKARSQFDELMDSCALEGEPSTWALFRANHLYCERLHMLAAGVRMSPFGSIAQSCAVYESQYPGVSKPLALLVQGETVALLNWHQSRGTFAQNALEYDGVYDQEETLFDEDA